MQAKYTEFAERVRKILRDAIQVDPDKQKINYDAQLVLRGNMAPEFADAIYFPTCPPLKMQDTFVIEKIDYKILFNGNPTVDPSILYDGALTIAINNIIISKRSLTDYVGSPFPVEPVILFVGSRNNHITAHLNPCYNWTHCKNCIAQVTLYGANIEGSTIIS
jgi:hypothetical protein